MLTKLSRGYKALKMLAFMGVTLCLLLTLSPHSAEATPHSSGSRDWPTDAELTPASSSVELMELQEDEAPHRLRRSAFLPLFSPFAKRGPIANELESLADQINRGRMRKARQELMDILNEMGK